MFLLIFLVKVFSWRNEYMLGPKHTETFWVKIDKKDALLTLELNQISTDGLINYRIKGPQKELNDNEFHVLSGESLLKNYKQKGTYKIEILNASKETVYFLLGCYVEKEIEGDPDKIEMKNTLKRLRRDLSNIYNLNLQLAERKQENIKQSRRYKMWLQILCLLPLVYALIGFLKLRLMKSFFTPVRK
ncbi:hypothetical protein SLOPH_1212 [Spraguea lophii 42_110]|uniref:GOLD domain-containing protein n=1 Tax=Spraguea lophii (strain 42_110) TaxID=1358809 RepID=S7W677_SPRLO|nr:hypothetical protein SLOPH_1212 [Spraguea lophii 42_110]